MPKSKAEESLNFQMKKIYKLDFEREYRFHPVRRWRFDFAFPEIKLAVEVQGITYFGGRENTGRHHTAKGIEADLEKYDEAMRFGWDVYCCSQKMVESGRAIETILILMDLRYAD